MKKLKLEKNQSTDEFMIIARVESLILNNHTKTQSFVQNYINAGADGIMIHSKEKQPKELRFCKVYNKFNNRNLSYCSIKFQSF